MDATRSTRRRGRGAFAAVVATLALTAQAAVGVLAHASPAGAEGPTNPIVAENARPGSPPSEWDVSGAGSADLQGFATEISVAPGDVVRFKVDTPATDYRLDVYRLGYYGGDGARKVATVQPSAALPQTQPDCLYDNPTGLIDCGNWAESASWDVPADAVSGVYIAKLVREDGHEGESHIPFVVRDDTRHAALLFQTSDTTWQAYNQYGGNSLYVGQPDGRAYKVSYNRPITTRGTTPEDFLFNAEYPMIRWLEANGYDVSYTTGVDTDRSGAELLEHQVFMSVGHDEYWSGSQRTNVEAARDAGVNLAFFSSNEIFWKTRWEPSTDASHAAYRTLVTYKETHAGAKIDPIADVWTGTWRDPRAINPEGPQPENALSGNIFTVNCCQYALEVPAADGKMRFWRNTDVANQAPGEVATMPDGTLGYEWDEDLDNGWRPAGNFRLSTTTVDVPERIIDHGTNYAPGTATHALTMHRATSGALVFGAGTLQWSWGLDGHHDRGSADPDPGMQQATVNLFADMGVQPASLQPGLTMAAASTDTQAPTSTVTAPAGGSTVAAGRVTVTGTATDLGGGVVGGVEVSVDGGATWHRADGREQWTYAWTAPAGTTATIRSRAVDDSGNLETASAGVTVTVEPRSGPYTIWEPDATPQNAALTDNRPIEIGTRFTTDVDGYATAIRFFKGTANTGTHVGHLWSDDGTLLATATFTSESANGWQEVAIEPPVALHAGSTYVVSYFSPTGYFADTPGYFSGTAVDNPPLHAPASTPDAPNGLYRYDTTGFPTDGNGYNYWVDVVVAEDVGPDTTPPSVVATSPADGATSVATNTEVRATLSEPLDAATVTTATFSLRDAGGLVPATVGYDNGAHAVTLRPDAPLTYETVYTATLAGGPAGVADVAGNALGADTTWSFTTAAAPVPGPDEGPGGPVLVVTDAADPFGRYMGQILQAEGLDAYRVTDVANVSGAVLSGYDVVVLAPMALDDTQVQMLTEWVEGGGNLIALRPDKRLAGLLGLTDATGTVTDAYLRVDTSTAPGAGIAADTMQFHGTADLYTATGARTIATLYRTDTIATANPAVTVRDVGTNGGQAAAFTYDLDRSVVFTRQGNPAWAGQERDGTGPIRSDDLFFGNGGETPQPDWVDLQKVQIPQADEQQRLLANLVEAMNVDRTPLPRFWYFPRDAKAVVVMTGDDHGNGGTAGQFDWFEAASATGCSVDDWQCIRSSSYVYPGTPLTEAQVAAYQAAGFEIGVHVNTDCADFTPASLAADYDAQVAALAAEHPSLAPQSSERTHCITWSDWATQPKVELAHGMRLDTNYYFWPGLWIQDRPGMFTGSGIPMRFADVDGTVIDVYQATTQMTDESDQSYPYTIDTLLANALGPNEYYGAFTANMHTDNADHAGAQAIVASAQRDGVPVVSGRQMLEWLDARNGSSFGSISRDGDRVHFTVTPGSGARGLRAMLPVHGTGGDLAHLSLDGSPVTFTTRTVNGVEYAFFDAAAGSYEATYATDTVPPAIAALTTTVHADGTATVAWTTDEPATSRVDFGSSPASLDHQAGNDALVTAHHVTLTGITPSTTYSYRVSSADAVGNTTTVPAPDGPPATFTTPGAAATDTTRADFGAGDTSDNVAVTADGDGAVTLAPTVGTDFDGTSLPAGWSAATWTAGGTATVGGGMLTVDGAQAGTDATFSAGTTLAFTATLQATAFEHAGFATPDFEGPWAMFSTGSSGSGLLARTNAGGTVIDEPIPGSWLGAPHRYRIVWGGSTIAYYVDDTLVATHAVAITTPMRAVASDYDTGGPAVTVDSLLATPYAAAGTFTSRVLDAQTAASWDALSWDAAVPAGASISMSVRVGDTPTPDATWSAFAPIGNGDAVGRTARYLQYRAALGTVDVATTPTLRSVTVAYDAGADTVPPTVTTRSPAPDAIDVPAGVTVAVGFDESIDASTVDAQALRLRADGAAADVGAVVHYDDATHTATLDPDAELAAGTRYTVAVAGTIADRAGNAMGADVSWSFTVARARLVDTTVADFTAGTGAGAAITHEDDGELTLAPALTTDFDGTALPAGWSSRTWGDGGAATVGSGALHVDGASAGTGTTFGAGRSLEFVATFGAASYQMVGFGDTLETDGEPWVGFGTHTTSTTLHARVNLPGVGAVNVPLAGNWLGAPHRYRIDWLPDRLVFSVDGTVVHTELATITGALRPIASDYGVGAPALDVDWLRVTPYAPNATFVSRVMDAGDRVAWGDMTWKADIPAGTSVAVSVRHGRTPEPDATWTDFTPVPASGSALTGTSRFVQYQLALSTSDPSVTPVLRDVAVSYAPAGPNHAPVAADDAYTVAEDTALHVGVPGLLANDTDADDDPLAALVGTEPSHGTLTWSGDGSFDYVPAPDFSGTDTFGYVARDGAADSAPTTVTITVTPVDDAPVGAPESYTTAEDTALHVPAPGVLANDTDVDDTALEAKLVTPPAHGTLTLGVDGSLTYTPAADYHGADAFVYLPSDGLEDGAPVTVGLTVTAVNDPPVAAPATFTVAEDAVLQVDAPGLLAGATDVDGDALATRLASAPSHGTASVGVDGSLTYTPAANYNGPDALTYVVDDGTVDSPPATVSITVTPVDDPPVAVADGYATAEDAALTVAPAGALVNDTDPDGDDLTARVASPPAHGSVTMAADGSFAYTPAPNFHGVDQFTYVANDGTVDSPPATVTITVTAVNDPPVATSNSYQATSGRALSVAAPGVLAGDTDVDGDPLTAVLERAAAHGKVTLAANGSFVYTSAAGFAGTDSFTYRASDGVARSAPAVVTIKVVAAPAVARAPYWKGWDIARGVMLRHDGTGGYTVDAWGGVHAWGGAPPMGVTRYGAPDWVSGAALLADDRGATVADERAGTFGATTGGAAPRVDASCNTAWRVGIGTRGIALDPAATGAAATRNGAEVDASGSIHLLCGSAPVNTRGAPSWPGWDIARGIAITPGRHGGFVLDAWGGIHPFGSARVLTSTGYWRGWDIARDIAIDGHGHGVVLDAWGGVHPFTYTG